jgi:RNA polymerase sigma factor (sigma-70 family)
VSRHPRLAVRAIVRQRAKTRDQFRSGTAKMSEAAFQLAFRHRVIQGLQVAISPTNRGTRQREPPLASALERPAGEWVESPYLYAVVRGVVRRYGLPKYDSEDLLQEVRLALLRHGLNVSVNPTFVFQTVVQKAVDMVRRRTRADRTLPQKADPVLDEELLHLLRARVSSLPERLQIICALRYRVGLTCREIADLLGVSRGKVRGMETSALEGLTHPRRRPRCRTPRLKNF